MTSISGCTRKQTAKSDKVKTLSQEEIYINEMSSRALRKLHGHQELEIFTPDTKNNESDENEEENLPVENSKNKKIPKKKPQAHVNPFELLDNEDNNDDVKENEQEELEEQQMNETKTNNRKKKKKKKRKNKEPLPSDGLNIDKEDEDEIDASIREVNRILESTGVSTTGTGSTELLQATSPITMNMRALLSVEHKNLNPDNEMKRIFGSRVVQAELSRRQRHRPRGRQKSWFATPKDTWPPMGKTGLTMALTETKNGFQYFIFEHSTQYQKVQFEFYEAVESLNPQNIANLLQLQPYHIDTLIQLSEVFRMSEDMQVATELIERALYSFEMSFHSLFSLTNGHCRLDFKRRENRAFFLAIFKHLTYVGQRGCYRTALEFCKLLLNLDPDGDPMCVLLMIDFYALRAEEYAFLVRLYHEWESHRNLSQLPNFAFSVPLAMYHDAVQNEKDTKKADDMLQDALMMFPGVLIPLLDKCGVNPDKEVSSHAFFGPNSQYSQSDALKQLIGLYVGRCHPSWKVSEVMSWLEKNVKKVLEKVDAKDPVIEEYRKKAHMRYQGTPRNILRHILISEVKDATAALPPDLANTTVLSYDPLPPDDSVEGYARPERLRRIQQESNALSMFFRSLLPNFNIDEPAGQDEGAVGGDQAGNNLRQGIGHLMDAMRDLLHNIRPVDPPVENQNGEHGENEDDEVLDEWD